MALISYILLPHSGIIIHILPLKKLRYKIIQLSAQRHIGSEELGQTGV